jgi:hypothetical protein
MIYDLRAKSGDRLRRFTYGARVKQVSRLRSGPSLGDLERQVTENKRRPKSKFKSVLLDLARTLCLAPLPKL